MTTRITVIDLSFPSLMVLIFDVRHFPSTSFPVCNDYVTMECCFRFADHACRHPVFDEFHSTVDDDAFDGDQDEKTCDEQIENNEMTCRQRTNEH